VKFMFPNQFSVYLHDTPTDRLFDRSKRTLSHGCVRVEDPVKLAGYVLAHQGGWSEPRIREAIARPKAGQTVAPITVDLKQPVPVYLVYLTAFMRNGVLQFRDDPYGKDSRVVRQMGKPAAADRSECEQLQELAGE